ncbi:MAG: hypothetical protein CMK71_17465 [Pseudomonadaceae bacterium]|nr:hypothetical protein [Pseudomonadaceae bacterium]
MKPAEDGIRDAASVMTIIRSDAIGFWPCNGHDGLPVGLTILRDRLHLQVMMKPAEDGIRNAASVMTIVQSDAIGF